MHKKFFNSTFFLLCECFALSNTHANDQAEAPLVSMKRLRQFEQTVNPQSTKQQKTDPNFNPTAWDRIPERIWKNISVYLLPQGVWKPRLINHHWRRAANASIPRLDLSPLKWINWECRSELEATQGHVGINFRYCEAYYCKGLDDQGTQKWNQYTQRGPCQDSLQEAPYNGCYTYGDGPTAKTIKEITYCNGSLFLWAPQSPPILCETSGEKLWKTDEVIFDDFKIQNPLKVWFTDILMDLSEFPDLRELNLVGNTAIIDSNLVKAITISTLTLRGNKVITNESVTRLTNLTTLDFQDASGITITDLDKLPNLKIVKFNQHQEMGDFFRLPQIQELYFLDTWKNLYDPYGKQQMMYIAEALFSLIAAERELSNHPYLPALKNSYEKRILLPNDRDLNFTKRRTTYPFNFSPPSSTVEEEAYLNQLAIVKAELLAEIAKTYDVRASLEQYWRYPWETSTEIYKIIIDLIKITGRNVTIFVKKDEVITSLEDMAKHQKTE